MITIILYVNMLKAEVDPEISSIIVSMTSEEFETCLSTAVFLVC